MMATPSVTEGLRFSIAVGIVIGLLASFVQSLGLTIQRKSHVLNQALAEDQRRAEHRRPLWLLGFAIFFSSNVLGSLFQIASLPVVILAPLGAVSLLWNAFFARLLLGDVFSAWMIIGTILIAGGAVLIAIFGIVPEPTRSIEDLLVLFSRPTFIAYFSLLGFVLAVCLAITHIVEWSSARRLPSLPPSPVLGPMLVPPVANPITITAHGMTEQTPLLDRKPPSSRASSLHSFASRVALPRSRVPLFLAISYASASGILSGMCLIFAKSGVELLLLTVAGDNQFWRWQTWVLLTGLVAFALLQLWYLHKALILADPTVVCPLAFCFYNLSSIVNGLVYFDQFPLIPWHHLLLVALGIFVLLCGVWIVSINSGGGGVDLGTWQGVAEDEVSSVRENQMDVESRYLPRTLSSSPERGQSSGGLRLGPIPIERQTVSESHTVSDSGYSFPEVVLNNTSTPSSPTHERRQTDPLLLSPSPRPRYNIRTSLQRRRPTLNTDTPRSPIQTYGCPSSPPLPGSHLVGTGFSIGLSPVSPGFVLVPRERRRRVSGVAAESQERAPLIRRSVSDGDVAPQPEVLSDTSGIAYQEEGEASLDPPTVVQGSRNRWKWVRSVFSRKRK